MRLFLVVMFCVLVGCSALVAQGTNPDIIPPSPPTLPSDVMYALGQQSGQLEAISARLDKIEIKVDGLRDDVTRINTVGGILLLLITVGVAPVVVYRIRERLGKRPAR